MTVNLPNVNQTGINSWEDVEGNDRVLRDAFNAFSATGNGGIFSSGKSIVAAEQTTTNSATYGLLGTPDRVSGIVLPTDGLIFVHYRALAKADSAAGTAAIFLNENQIKGIRNATGPSVAETVINDNEYQWLYTIDDTSLGFSYAGASGSASDGVTTGLIGPATIAIEAAAGTYDVSVRFKASVGGASAKDRKLRVWSQSFG